MTELLASVRLLDLFLRRNILMQLVDQLMCKEFQFRLKPQQAILEKAILYTRKLFWVFLSLSALDILVHVVVVPGLGKFSNLPLKMDLIWFDISQESYFTFVYIYQVSYKPMVLGTFMALQTLPWAAMCCAISQLNVLIYNLENIKYLVELTMAEMQCDSNTAFKEVFKGCILHHCSIVRFVNTIQNAFGGQLTSTLWLNGCIVGTTAVQIFSIESPLNNITDVAWILAYLFIMIGYLFVDCYFGNSVTIKTSIKRCLITELACIKRGFLLSMDRAFNTSEERLTGIYSKNTAAYCYNCCEIRASLSGDFY
ncbi:unnamed protein product [Arctia plantaginis]|uniref:Odorant receptor n=1 Tax=Arctia plantaginis TaxID=874455 RepID=A0A8S1BEV5_ARCPL|nr:unnamed protein product [Arctia plantaginis]CAB3260673.1 unnamed protein product [Arctia plantaginis]